MRVAPSSKPLSTAFRAKATKAKAGPIPSQDDRRRMQPIVEHHEEGGVRLTFPESEELAPPLFNIDHVDAGYDGKTVLSNVSAGGSIVRTVLLCWAPMAMASPPSSSFLRAVLKPLSGEVSKSGKLRVGYFAAAPGRRVGSECNAVA